MNMQIGIPVVTILIAAALLVVGGFYYYRVLRPQWAKARLLKAAVKAMVQNMTLSRDYVKAGFTLGRAKVEDVLRMMLLLQLTVTTETWDGLIQTAQAAGLAIEKFPDILRQTIGYQPLKSLVGWYKIAAGASGELLLLDSSSGMEWAFWSPTGQTCSTADLKFILAAVNSIMTALATDDRSVLKYTGGDPTSWGFLRNDLLSAIEHSSASAQK